MHGGGVSYIRIYIHTNISSARKLVLNVRVVSSTVSNCGSVFVDIILSIYSAIEKV